MAKQRKSLRRGISQELSRRASGEVTRQKNLVRSRAFSNFENLMPRQLRWMLPYLTSFRPDFGGVEEEEETSLDAAVVTETRRQVPKTIEPLYQQYTCVLGNPLSCDRAQNLGFKYCAECGFPAVLPEKAEIRGSKGRYRIESLLEQRGFGRLYQGSQVSDNQRVLIKEYLLPDVCFSAEETRLRKQVFERVAGLNLADGRVQDFRLIHPWDAIADANEERCYLVTKGTLNLYPTLREDLAVRGPMSGMEVRQVLSQVLQTLECLHGQKFRFPSGQVQKGLAHGNLNLDSLLIAQPKTLALTSQNKLISNSTGHLIVSPRTTVDSEFFIYTCDLALWESLFDPLNREIVNPSLAKDLVDLGYVAFYLLAGQTINPISRHPLNPRDEQQWPSVDLPLQSYLQRLMGLSVPFESAASARQALLKLPIDEVYLDRVAPITVEETNRNKTPRILWFLLGIIGLTLLGWLIWFFSNRSNSVEVASENISLCCMSEVPAVPAGDFIYTAEDGGTWQYVLKQENLVERGRTLEEEFEIRQPKLQLYYQGESSGEAAIEQVRLAEADFAISSLVGQVTPELDYQEVAYDGIVIFVNFSYSKREKGLPEALKGQITFEDLQRLYTGKITNWQQLGGPDLPVRLYMPTETEVVRIFEERILRDESKINVFRSLSIPENDPNSFLQTLGNTGIKPLPTFAMLRQVIQDFENERVGAIAFAPFSKVFGQCSVYPLALIDGKNPPVQALIGDNGQPITPATDLCRDKGSYHPNLQAFKTGDYPLAYPIAVIYPRDNSRPPAGRKFADILRTQEGQQLLGKTGLVPLYPVSQD